MDLELDTILLFEKHGSVCGCPEFWSCAPWTSASTCPTVDIRYVWKSQLQSLTTNGAEQGEDTPSSYLWLASSNISPFISEKVSLPKEDQPNPTMNNPLGITELEEPRSTPVGPPRETCIFWYHGACQRGEQCKWAHELHITWPIHKPPGYVHNFPCNLPLCPVRVGMAELVKAMTTKDENTEYGSNDDADMKTTDGAAEKETEPKETCFFWYHGHCRRILPCPLAHEVLGTKLVSPPPGYYCFRHICELPLCSITAAVRGAEIDTSQSTHASQDEDVSMDIDEDSADSDSERGSDNGESHDSGSHDAELNDSEYSDSSSDSGSERAEEQAQVGAFDAVNNASSRPATSTSSSGWNPTTFSSRQPTPKLSLQTVSHQGEIEEGVGGEEDREGAITHTFHRDTNKQDAPLPPQNLHPSPTKPKNPAQTNPTSTSITTPALGQVSSEPRQPPRGPKAFAAPKVQLCFFWYHTGYCTRHLEKTCRFWHREDFKGTLVSEVALPPNVNGMRHDPDCELQYCPLSMLRRKQAMEYYEDLNQDLIKENMSAEGIAEQPRIKDNTMAEGEAEQPRIKEEVMAEGIPEQPRFEGNTMTVGIPYRPRIKVEDPPDNLFDFSSVPTGPKADRVDKDHVHPSRRRGLRLHGQEPEKVTKKRAKGQKAQPIGKQKQRQRGQKQKKASAGQGQAKDAAGARIGPNGRVKKPRGKKTGNKKGEAKELNRAEILEKSVAGQRIKTESSNDLDAVKPKARPVRQNANFTPLGPRRKELNTLRGIGAAQLAEIARSDSGDKDMDEMEGVEAQPWFLFGFPGEEPKAPQEKVKVDYELPKDNTRAPWDTDVLRRAFGEIE